MSQGRIYEARCRICPETGAHVRPRLLARLTAIGIEIWCRGCKTAQVIPVATVLAFYRHRQREGPEPQKLQARHGAPKAAGVLGADRRS